MALSGRDRPIFRPGFGRLLVGLVLTAGAGLPLLVILGRVIYAALGPSSADPHGYLMIFGVVAALVLVVPLIIGVVLIVAGVRVRSGLRPDRVPDVRLEP